MEELVSNSREIRRKEGAGVGVGWAYLSIVKGKWEGKERLWVELRWGSFLIVWRLEDGRERVVVED
jgi:hypothetical protein